MYGVYLLLGFLCDAHKISFLYTVLYLLALSKKIQDFIGEEMHTTIAEMDKMG